MFIPALTLLGKLIHHLAWNYGCCYCCSCCRSDPPPKIKRLTAVVDSIEQYRWVTTQYNSLSTWKIFPIFLCFVSLPLSYTPFYLLHISFEMKRENIRYLD